MYIISKKKTEYHQNRIHQFFIYQNHFHLYNLKIVIASNVHITQNQT